MSKTDHRGRPLDAPFTPWENLKYTIGSFVLFALPLAIVLIAAAVGLYWAGVLGAL